MSVLSRFMRSAPSRPNASARPLPARPIGTRTPGRQGPAPLAAPAPVRAPVATPAAGIIQPARPPWPARTASGLPGLLGLWMWRAKARRDLAQLDDLRLADVGISRAEARREARKPFWRA